jgi:dTDP-4-amino-4,6-dideoxygalactose transaminase
MKTPKTGENSFALFGAPPAFEKVLPVGQLYFPSWERYEAAMRGIFERRYYTNQGPLACQLEEQLQQFLGVKHAICVANATIGLMMAAEALNLKGKVILPAFTFAASAQSLSWCGIEPVFCDVNPLTHHITPANLEKSLDSSVSGIMGVNLWGGTCDPAAITEFARQHALPAYFDSAHAFGCVVNNVKVGNFGSVEVFSFHATKILNATEGGCVCTNDDDLAARLRNIRSGYGAGRPTDVRKTANGRMSEAQAAIALMSLEDFPENQRNNARLRQSYEVHLNSIPGIHVVKPSGVSFSNYQYLVCEVDEKLLGFSRDALLTLLKAENVNCRRYFYPGLHRTVEYISKQQMGADLLPVTDRLCATCLQLPLGALVTLEAIETICGIVQRAHLASELFQSVSTHERGGASPKHSTQLRVRNAG